MATIQIRDIPEETYETIRLRARAAGQSIQAYMRDQVIALAAQPTKNEVIAAIRAVLAREGRPTTMADIVADVAAGRDD
ncbi:antitoxin [Kutzneria sp. NPDC051319]|uniref:FitA-like ribbon-helix-helix domain-containing protein n=1 Tax=Kutzneria sp. NPDC051319 TaxID=3155047 RepID=UPI0034200C4E